MHRPGLILALLLLSLSCCPARVQQSQEAVTAGAIAAWTRMCMEVNGGTLPTSWPEYRETLKISLNDILETTQPTRRYGVMNPPVPLIAPLQGQMVVVTRKPIEDLQIPSGFLGLGRVLKGPGRYIIYKDAGAKIHQQWVTEEYVIKTFAAANLPLPEQDDEPERPWVTEARRTMSMKRYGYGAALGVLILASVGILMSGRSRQRNERSIP
jgi:hypothetical protein